MGDVRLTPQVLGTAGATTTRTAITTGNVYQVLLSPGGTVLNFIKTGSNNATITIITPGTVDGLAIADRTFQVDATTGDMVARYFPEHYADSAGDLEFTTNEGTAITCAVLER